MLHVHVTSWFLALVLFFVSYFLSKQDKQKGAKITHMVLRLVYLFVIGTGAYWVVSYQFAGAAIVKSILALLLIGLMEMILVKTRDRDKTGVFWVFFIIDFILVIFYGYVVIG